MTTLTINEATHSPFYAPFYLAIQLGFFDCEQLSIRLGCGRGSNHAMEALQIGQCDISLLGPETSIYAYEQKFNKRVLNFAKLTSFPGTYIVARQPLSHFDWNDMRGSLCLGDRHDSLSQVVLEYILRKNGINTDLSLAIDQTIPFGNTADAFANGYGDYTLEFDPYATDLEENYGCHIIQPLATTSCPLPFTTFCTTKCFLEGHQSLLQSFTNAVQRGARYASRHYASEVAYELEAQFPCISHPLLTQMIKRYQTNHIWSSNLMIQRSDYQNLIRLLISRERIKEAVPFERVIANDFARKSYQIFH